MIKRGYILFLLLTVSLLHAKALEVCSVEAGSVSSLIDDKTVTSLVLSGEIDARDLQFIASQLSNLQHLDMSEAKVMAYSYMDSSSGETIEYVEDEFPAYCFFAEEGLASVVLPNTLKSIGEAAFAGCSQLLQVKMPQNLLTVGDYAFCGCMSLQSVNMPSELLKIGERAFGDCFALKELDLSGIKGDCLLGEYVFADCVSLEMVKFGPNITAVPTGAFAGCENLSSLQFGEKSSLSSVGNSAFASTALRSFNFSSLYEIGEWAFASVQLQEISLPASLTCLQEGSFFYSKAFTRVSVPEGVSEIGAYVFNGCSAIERVTLPSTLTFLGSQAFEDNSSLTSMMVKAAEAPELGDRVFAGVNQSDATLIVPESSMILYQNAPQWCEFKIDSIQSSVDNVQLTDVKVYFDGAILCADASETISRLNVYNTMGVNVASIVVDDMQARLHMHEYFAPFYVVEVRTTRGETKVVKLIRQ